MLVLGWIISVIAAACIGYWFKSITAKIQHIETVIAKKVDKPPDTPDSVLIDPTDPIQEAMLQQQEVMRRLNS